MAPYTRPDSKYWQIYLEGSRERFPIKILKKGRTPAQTKENRQLAWQVYHAAMGDKVRNQFDVPTAVSSVILFQDHAQWYLDNHTLKHDGALQEKRKIDRLVAFFGAYPLDEITPHLWTEYETERMTKDGVKQNTVGRELAIMKGILDTAIGEHLAFHQLGQVARITVPIVAKRTITGEEHPAFLAALTAIDEEIADMYAVGVGTLLRQEQLIYLQRHEHRGDRLAVMTKTGPHEVLLTGPTVLQEQAAAVLARRLPADNDGFFFPRWKATFAAYEDPGQPGEMLRQRVRRAAKAVNIPWGLDRGGIVWHTATRATGATRLLREYAIDARTVQLIGNWKSLDQMAEYLGIKLDLAAQQLQRRA